MNSAHFQPRDSDGNRTRVTAVKGRCLNRLTTEPYYGLSASRNLFTISGRICEANSLCPLRAVCERFIPRASPTARCGQPPRVGLEPTTPRLTAACSTIELSRIIDLSMYTHKRLKLFNQPERIRLRILCSSLAAVCEAASAASNRENQFY